MISSQNIGFALPIYKQRHVNPIVLVLLTVFVWLKRVKEPFVITVGALLLPLIIPLIQFGYVFKLWSRYAVKVDRRSCSCSCWDTVFKGIYETGVAGYKHVYFNATSNTFCIWSITVIYVIAFYEAARFALSILFQKHIRMSMLLLLLSAIYPHYYTWWLYFNYLNDEFYSQWHHQLFFSFTEILSTLFVLHLLDSRNSAASWKLLVIIDIAVVHILASGFDQFISNVVKGEGMLHQVLRDVGFMIPDILHIAVPILELSKLAKSVNLPAAYLISNQEFVLSIIFIFSTWFLCLRL